MPKMKTHRGAAKRIKATGSGRLVRRRAYKSHLLQGKNAKRKRRLRNPASVSSADERRVRRILPYI